MTFQILLLVISHFYFQLENLCSSMYPFQIIIKAYQDYASPLLRMYSSRQTMQNECTYFITNLVSLFSSCFIHYLPSLDYFPQPNSDKIFSNMTVNNEWKTFYSNSLNTWSTKSFNKSCPRQNNIFIKVAILNVYL